MISLRFPFEFSAESFVESVQNVVLVGKCQQQRENICQRLGYHHTGEAEEMRQN